MSSQVSIKRQFAVFCLRLLFNTLGLWIAIRLLADNGITFTGGLELIFFGGLMLSVVNTLLKPIIVIFSLPAILLSLGLFMIIVNGVMVFIAAALTPSLDVTFGAAVLAGMIIAVVNYALSGVLELNKR
ncbi:phage holin family protein [Candidatus Saccharibacteria bacterium]|nr:phage holin family protein [Candidatus Saccharibacteria bacterium]